MSRPRRRALPSPVVRRLFSVPLAWAAALSLTGLAPVALAVAIVVDVALRRRFASTRFFAFLLALAWIEAGGAAIALVIGGKPGPNYRLQREWASLLSRAAFACWSIRLEVEGDADLSRGPYLLLSRHATLADTLLPILLAAGRHHLLPRYVLKRELQWDPCLDIVGGRIPNVFVDRELGDVARAARGEEREALRLAAEAQRQALVTLARGMEENGFVAIYPEGHRYSASRRTRALARLQGEERAAAERLTHVLPVHAGGFLALLEGAPTADVVVVAHAGMEGSAHLADLASGSVIGARWRVRVTRYPRASLPTTEVALVAWLRERWVEVDRWVAARVGPG